MSIRSKIVVLLLFAMGISACDRDPGTAPADQFGAIKIDLIDAIQVINDTVRFSIMKDSLIQDELQYYWDLGNEKPFIVGRDTFGYVYRTPGLYRILLIATKAKDGSVVASDSVNVEIVDTLLSPSLFKRFTGVICSVRAVFFFKNHSSYKGDTSYFVDTMVTFSLASNTWGIQWDSSAFSLIDQHTEKSENATSGSSSSSYSNAYGSVLELNREQRLMFALWAGEGYSSYSRGGYRSAYSDSWEIALHFLPFVEHIGSTLVFREHGTKGLQLLESCQKYSSSTNESPYAWASGYGEIRIAPLSIQTDSAFVEVKFLR